MDSERTQWKVPNVEVVPVSMLIAHRNRVWEGVLDERSEISSERSLWSDFYPANGRYGPGIVRRAVTMAGKEDLQGHRREGRLVRRAVTIAGKVDLLRRLREGSIRRAVVMLGAINGCFVRVMYDSWWQRLISD